MTSFIGVDAGGSKTAVLLANGEQIVARASGPPGAVRPGRALHAASRIAAVVRRALTDGRLLEADVLVVGAAGVGREPERGELREGLRGERLARHIVVTGDLDIALEAAFGAGPGIVLVSGTGSVAVARTPDGKLHRQGGYGWQMGDEGSGYWVGRAALLAAGRARDGRGERTALTEALLGHPPVKTFDELVRWSGSAEPGEIAGLAPLLFRVAAKGDAVAQSIIEAAAESLTALVIPLVSRFAGRGHIALAVAGGNLAPERGLRAPVLAKLRRLHRLTVREDPLDPAEGALAMARRSG